MYNISFHCVIFRMNRLAIARICLTALFVLHFSEAIPSESKASAHMNGKTAIDKKGNNPFATLCTDNHQLISTMNELQTCIKTYTPPLWLKGRRPRCDRTRKRNANLF